MKTKINFKSLFFHLLIPIMLSFIISMLIGDFSTYYNSIRKPIDVSEKVFPIVWSFLYLIMGLSAYFVENVASINTKSALKYYYIGLLLNLLWTPVFFYFKLRGLSLILITALVIISLLIFYKFFKIKKLSGYLLIPYLLFLMFAYFLTAGVYFMNL